MGLPESVYHINVHYIFLGTMSKNTKSGGNVDTDLLEALRSGSHEAFEKVFYGLHKSIYCFVYSLVKSADESEEITQDIFVKLWEKRENIDPSRNLNGYVFTIAKNCSLKYLAAQKEFRAISEVSLDDNQSTDDYLMVDDIKLLLDITIARMPKLQGQVYRLHHEFGYSNEEIAKELNISKTAVSTHLHSARKEVRKILMSIITLMTV